MKALRFLALTVFLAGCTVTPQSSISTTETQDRATSQILSTPTNKETCGDPYVKNAVWFGVFVESDRLNEIQTQFCKDAIAVTRQDTGKRAVQVASFTDFIHARNFAQTVNGEIAQYDPDAPSDKLVVAIGKVRYAMRIAAIGTSDADIGHMKAINDMKLYCTLRNQGMPRVDALSNVARLSLLSFKPETYAVAISENAPSVYCPTIQN